MHMISASDNYLFKVTGHSYINGRVMFLHYNNIVIGILPLIKFSSKVV